MEWRVSSATGTEALRAHAACPWREKRWSGGDGAPMTADLVDFDWYIFSRTFAAQLLCPWFRAYFGETMDIRRDAEAER